MLTEENGIWRGKWLIFAPGPDKPKTKTWRVGSQQPLGWIQWHGGWRKYTFFPGVDTMYDADCLREIAEFCEARTKEVHASWRRDKTMG